MTETKYIHGTQAAEQKRLAALNDLVNPGFLDFLQLDGARTVLEVGSGLGVLTREVARRQPELNVVGVEYSSQQLARAEGGLPNLRFVQGDANNLEFADDSFDVVYCRWVLEHVAQPSRVLQEIRRVVRPGGRVFLFENDTTMQCYDPPIPGFERIWSQLSVLQQELGGDSLIGRRLFRLLKAAGFKDIQLSMGNEVYHSGTPKFSVWVENEIAIIEGCRADLTARGLANSAQVDQAIKELQDLVQRDDATSWFYWNRAVGVK